MLINHKRNRFFFVVIASLFLFIIQPVKAQDKTSWAQARQNFLQNNNSKKPGVKVQAINELVNAIYSEAEPEAVDLLVRQLTDEINLSGGKSDDKVDESVLDLCVTGLKKITTEKAIDKIIKSANNKGLIWRVRFYVLKGMGGINNPQIISALVELIADKDAKIKIGAINALGELKAKEGTEHACKLLNSEEAWEVKIAAAEYLGKLNDQSLIEPLIQVLLGRNLEGRPRDEVAKVLKQLTGADCGLQGSAWSKWWNSKKNGDASASPDQIEETTAVYYGVKITSTRIIFILDVSGSMDWGAQWVDDPEANKKQLKPKFTGSDGKAAPERLVDGLNSKKAEIDKRPVSKRIHAAKRELVNTVYNLDPSVYFTIVFFSAGVKAWKETLVPATAENKLAAVEEIDKHNPETTTATFDALEFAYKLSEQGTGKNKKVGLDKKGYVVDVMGGADTIFLVSDGIPTAGRILDRNSIVSEIKKINETRKIKINTVGVGSSSGLPQGVSSQDGLPDVNFLKQLAEVTGGTCIDKTNK